jgi:hypothetical protein
VQQQAMQKKDARENLYTRLCPQTWSRKITRACVPLMVARLGAHWTSASCRELVYPIVQTMVVLEQLGGIAGHEEYEELRSANKACEGTLLQRMQETWNRGAKAMRDKTRELVMPFFRDNDCKIGAVQRIKWETFGVSADGNLLPDQQQIAVELAALPSPVINGTSNNARAFYDSSPHLVYTILQVNADSLSCLKPKRIARKGRNHFAPPAAAMAVNRARRPL